MMMFICICLFVLTAPFWSEVISVAFKLLFSTTKVGVGLVCAAGSKDGEETGPTSFKKFINGVAILGILLIIVLSSLTFILNRIS